MKLIKIIPKENTKFIFGKGSKERVSDIFHSDSLISALISMLFDTDANREVDDINIKSVSSLFYGYDSVFFIPKPLSMSLLKYAPENRKINKKIKWISLKAYLRILKGESTKEDFLFYPKNKETFMITKEEDLLPKEGLISKITETKNKVSRRTQTVNENEGGLFSISSLILNKGVFFYFLVSELTDDLRKALDLLPYYGLGGKISTGYGQIKEVKIEDIPDELNQILSIDAKSYTNLSIVFFKDIEEFKRVKSYKPYFSRGFISGKVWNSKRSSVLGIMEGAEISDKIEGTILRGLEPEGADVKIVRYGEAFLIPCVENEEGDNYE